MINHVRTLLSNQISIDQNWEYVPDDYEQRKLPECVEAARIAVFGEEAVGPLEVYQMMRTLHSTELEEHVLAKDPRVTYLPFDDSHCIGAHSSCTVTWGNHQLAEEHEDELFGDRSKEPNKTWYNLWKTHDQLPYKLGGLFMAMADATERAPVCHTPQ